MKATAGIAMTAWAVAATAAWFDDLKPQADVRYRFEHVDEEGRDERYHNRLRVRAGLTAPANEEVTLALRLTTAEQKNGVADPISGNRTLRDFGAKKSVFLDVASIEWTPRAMPGTRLVAGKMVQPFLTAGDYLWDADYTPEGVAAAWGVGELWRASAVGAYHWIQERSSDDDSMMYGGQLALAGRLHERVQMTLAGSVYAFTEMEGRPVFDWQGAGRSYGNSTRTAVIDGVTNTVYVTGFTTVEALAALDVDVGLPLHLFAAWAVNTDVDDENDAVTIGARLGRMSKPGSVQVGYDYRRLEADSFPGAFTDSDSFGGGVDARGHKLCAAVQLMKGLQASVSYFLDEKRLDDPHHYRRLQVDLTAKF